MSNLGPQQQNVSYDGLLQIPGGVTAQLQQVQDGEGRGTGLYLSSAGTNAATSSSFAASVNGVTITNVVPRLISDGFGDYLSVKDFGATGDGVTDDTIAIQNAVAAVAALGGGTVFYPSGVYKTTAAITLVSGVTHCGSSRVDINNSAKPASKIVNESTDIFVNTTSTITGVYFKDLWIESDVGGGHIFNWSQSGIVAKVEIFGCSFIQKNRTKAVINGTASGGVFSIWMHDFEWEYVANNTIPAIYIASPTVNSIVIDTFWSTCASQVASTGTYSIWLESTNPSGPGIDNIVRNGVFELPIGGSINMLSCYASGVELCGVYDISVVTNNPQFRIAKGASSIPSNNCWMMGLYSRIGTSSKPDAQIDASVAAQGNFRVENCNLAYLDGVGTSNGPAISIINAGSIQNIINCAYTSLNASASTDLTFGSTSGTSKTYTLWNGYSGNFDGYLNIYQNGAYIGAIASNGRLGWGGSQTSPNFYVQQSGTMFSKGHVYPGTPAGVDQAASGLLAGSGVPSNANGNDGDFYFRGDGGAGTSIYMKRSGSWVGIV